MKNKINYLILVLIASSCLIPKKRVKETYATFIKSRLSANSGSINTWQFTNNGKTYTVNAWKPPFKIPGDKYIIIFDSLHPSSKYYLDGSRPVFVLGEETSRIKGIIMYDECRYPRKKNKWIEYEYHLNGIRYKTTHFLLKGQDTICYKAGDSVDVEYWVPNPLRSIVHLDTLIKTKLMQLKK